MGMITAAATASSSSSMSCRSLLLHLAWGWQQLMLQQPALAHPDATSACHLLRTMLRAACLANNMRGHAAAQKMQGLTVQ
jgi:hypothetical protein